MLNQTKKGKLLLVTSGFPPYIGSHELVWGGIARNLKNLGWKITVLTHNPEKFEGNYLFKEWENIPVYVSKEKRYGDFPFPQNILMRNFCSFLPLRSGVLFKDEIEELLNTVLKKESFDFIITDNAPVLNSIIANLNVKDCKKILWIIEDIYSKHIKAGGVSHRLRGHLWGYNWEKQNLKKYAFVFIALNSKNFIADIAPEMEGKIEYLYQSFDEEIFR